MEYTVDELAIKKMKLEIKKNKEKKMRTNISWSILKKTCPKNQNDFYS